MRSSSGVEDAGGNRFDPIHAPGVLSGRSLGQMRMSRPGQPKREWAAVWVATLLPFGGTFLAAEPPLPDLPVLRLDGFEADVRTQLRQAEEAARARPHVAEASGRLGMMLHAHEQYELAAPCYARARRLAPRELRWPYYHGLVQTALGEHREAVAAFKTALRLQPDDVPSQLRLADVLLAAGEFQESQALYEALLRKGAAITQARYGLGQIAVATGREAAGIEHYLQAVAAFPAYGRAHYALALALRDQGRMAEAQEHLALSQRHRYQEPGLEDPLLRTVAELNTTASDQLLQGTFLEATGKLEPSIAAHERALQKNPALVQAHINLISLYTRAKQFEKAEEHYWAAVAANPELADSHFSFGLLLVQMGRPTQAEEAFRRSLERNPFNPEAHFNYALIIERDGRLEEAATHYRQAIENDPGHRLAHFHLGMILVSEERPSDAIPHFREILAPDDDDTPRFTYALGATYARLDDKEQALHYLSEALRKATALGQAELARTIERDLKALAPEP